MTELDIPGDVVAMHAEWARDDITLAKLSVASRDAVFDDATIDKAETTISGIWTPRKHELAATKAGGAIDEYDELRALPDVNVEAGDHVKVDGVERRVEAVIPAYRYAQIVEKVARCVALEEAS